MRNVGQTPVWINGVEVPPEGVSTIPHMGLCEVGDVALLLVVNVPAVLRAVQQGKGAWA